MNTQPDGHAIARQRIADEARDRTGFLDLSQLGLTEFPEAVLDLGHLRRLHLGYAQVRVGEEWQRNWLADGPKNSFGGLDRLAALRRLTALSIGGLQCDDLAFVVNLTGLQTLDCSSTQVSELAPLAGLPALQTLDCSNTQVSELAPLAGLPALQTLQCNGCHLIDVPDPVWHLPSLRKIVLYQSSVSGILAEVLSQSYSENCLDAVRTHLRDNQAGTEVLTDVKLLVLGNGRSGKTQLARFMCGDPFQPEWDSTHGIRVVTTVLAATQSQPAPTLHIWDFGGQDIYHGTHALFVRTRAVFALIWASNTEPPPLTYDHQGLTFRNHPLQYWATYVGHLNADQGPVIVVQTKCDTDAVEAPVFPLPPEARTLLGPVREVRFSALSKHRGHEELLATLRGATARLWEHQGIAEIGKGRLKLQRRIEALRQPDGSLPDQWKRMDKPTFRAWCEQAGDISSPDEMLRYLHNAGIVIYQKGLFDDLIILDHAWALNAIYAVFDRTKSYRRLLQDQGRFDRPRLEELVWPDFTPDEQRLFLTMMRSSGICFIYRSSPSRGEDDDTIYIAPDLLPERATVQTQIEARWGLDPPQASVTFDYPMLHPGLMRTVTARVGGQAGIDAIYWRGGVTVYETELRSHALIEHAISEGACTGTVTLQTKGAQAWELLNRLADWIKEENDRLGLRPSISDTSPRRQTAPTKKPRPLRHNSKAPAEADRQQERSSVVKFGPVPPSRPQCSVSYAWNDPTPSGPDRESVVDQLEAGAKQHGLHLLRDKTDMQLGDRISEFMRQLVTSERVFVILSDKYLHSIYCMSELHEIWRRCVDDKTFVDRVRVLTLPDANIADIFKHLEIVKWWQERQRKIKEAATEVDWRLSGPHFDEYRQTGKIADDASAILALVQDTLRPKRAEELLRIAFEGLPRH
jgi:internalin A